MQTNQNCMGPSGLEEGRKPGNMIISLNVKQVPDVSTSHGLLGDVQAGSPVVLQIKSIDQLRFIALDLQ
jgi:hypothetical protein